MIRSNPYRLIPSAAGFLALLSLSACGHLNALVNANRIEREARAERVKFLETARDAYLLIGNEYYKLAKLAEIRGDAKKTKEYADQAGLYAVIYNDLKIRARELRDSLDERATGDDAPTTREPEEFPL